MQKFCLSLLFLAVSPFLFGGQSTARRKPVSPPPKTSFKSLHVVRKNPAAATGDAVVELDGKVRRLARHAYQAWPVMNGDNALVLLNRSEKGRGVQVHLMYVVGDGLKHRDLGAVPFTSAALHEERLPGDRMAFVLSGKRGAIPAIIVTDRNTVHAEIDYATNPVISQDTLTYDSTGGGTRSVRLASLIGSDLHGIYENAGDSTSPIRYAQFQKDGTAYIIDRENHSGKGSWRTNGFALTVTEPEAKTGAAAQPVSIARSDLKHVAGIPAGLHLTVRLLNPLSSFKAHEGDLVDCVLISPPYVDGQLFLPQGVHVQGTITKAHSVGWAVPHETAALTVDFHDVVLEDGTKLPIQAHLFQVENSREKVNAGGTIEGVRSTGTFGHTAESKVASVAAFEPVAYLFTTVSATSLLGFAEPEILYSAGTELLMEVDSPVITAKTYPPTSPALAESPKEHQDLVAFVHKLPFLTVTKGSNKPSDVTNLVFLGKPDALLRAFKAAGWVQTDELNANSTYMTIKSLGGTQTYNQAPMSVLLLDERPPIITLSKTTNTFNSRHHLRIFDPLRRYDNDAVFTASSTQDVGIAFSAKQRTFIHVIDEYIDNERSKIVQDLQFTGCVEAAEYVDRPWVPKDAYNSTGDQLRTDGAAVVLKMSSCEHPRTTSDENAVPPARFQRIIRDTVLTIRNDLIRGNVGYQGVTSALWARNYFAHRNDLKPDNGAWLQTDLSGENYRGTRAGSQEEDEEDIEGSGRNIAPPAPPPTPEVINARNSHRWDPPRYEVGLQGGYLRYPTTRTEGVLLLLASKDPVIPDYFTIIADQVNGGWSAGIYVIANTWKRFSNEFSYNYQRGKYETINLSATGGEGTDVDLDGYTVGLITRQFEYNLLFNLRSAKSRWRPYLAAGPALQLISLDGATLKKPAGPFRLGLQNIGILKSAFDFGGTPPLEGGGIWQLGLQYGAGVKFRVLPRLTINADFRETWSKNPDFIRDSYTADYFSDEEYDLTVIKIGASSKFRQQRFTVGFAFTF